MILSGKRVIVTGAARGIGLAAVRVLVAAGARVAIADLDEAQVCEAAAEFPNGAVVAIGVDVSDAVSVKAMVEATERAFGGLDGMFNNAGVMLPGDADVTETDDIVWDKTLSVNLKGVFQCCRFGIPAMIASGGGAIVNNASIVGLLGSYPSQIAYTASKGGVIALTRELGVSYARRGVRVNAVSPGVTQTAMADQLAEVAEGAAREDKFRHIPIGRYAAPEEIGRTVAFLLSDHASYITAQNWPVDGGLTSAYLCPPFPE